MASNQELPFVDEHVRVVRAGQDRTWTALQEYVDGLTTASHGVLSRILGTVPRSGFEVVEIDPPREIVLGGRHRFSTYHLVFRVDPDDDRSRLSARTYAAFPGLHGLAYRTGLMLTTGHRRATQHMLRAIARTAEG